MKLEIYEFFTITKNILKSISDKSMKKKCKRLNQQFKKRKKNDTPTDYVIPQLQKEWARLESSSSFLPFYLFSFIATVAPSPLFPFNPSLFRSLLIVPIYSFSVSFTSDHNSFLFFL